MSSTKRLLSNSTIVFTGMMIANIFSYLFNMMTGRMLGPADYGELTVLMSFFMVASLATGAISTITMRYSGELYFAKSYKLLGKFYNFMIKNVLYFSLALSVIILILIKPITSFFSVTNWLAVLPVLVSIIFILLLTVNKGMLQGLQKFIPVSYVNALEMTLRFAIAFALVLVGWRVYGALIGVALATMSTFLISHLLVAKTDYKSLESKGDKNYSLDKKEMLNYGLPAFISSAMLILSLNMDIFLVKHYFSSEQAGLYAAISVIAKIILYVSSPIIQVMFPMISEHRAKGEKHYKIFLYSLLLTLLACLLILGVYTMAPGTIIKILYGNQFVAYFGLLPEIGLAFLFYSLVNLMANYFMAIKDFFFAWFYGAAIILQIILAYFWHGDLLIIVRIFVFTFALLFALMLGYYTYIKRQQITALLTGTYEAES